MAKQQDTNADPRPETAVPPTTDSAPSAERQAILREALLHISSMKMDDSPGFLEEWPMGKFGEEWGNRYLWGSYQPNLDLALAANMEAEKDIDGLDGGDGWFHILYATGYWQLREAFLADCLAGKNEAFIVAIWRAYTAGRVCPNRLRPRSHAQRVAAHQEDLRREQVAKQVARLKREEALSKATEILSK